MPLHQCAVGIGEVLIDVFENGDATVGGAPFNVTFHMHQLMHAMSVGEAVFLSAIGLDAWGRQICDVLEAAGMSTRYLAEVEKPTGTALVFEQDGGAGFEIQPDVAWDSIQLNESGLELGRRCAATVFGSLAQRSEPSRSSIRRFVSQVRGHRLYDVNLRRNTGSGVAGYTTEIIAESLSLATLVKMNDTELKEVGSLLGFTPESSDPEDATLCLMERLHREFSLDPVAITRGSKGALLLSAGKHLRLPDSTFDQALVHPVGAGDSFAAGLLFGIMQGWRPQESLQLANILSSWVVQNVSATPLLPENVLAQIRALADDRTVIAQTGEEPKAQVTAF
jgi:fructokinase